ncbi:MAG: ChbG/HpnK family deacetylase [Planctomycetes bacterium]|nr:ChbG/HpnK family deacetylase [Planctomycetota bacterium]
MTSDDAGMCRAVNEGTILAMKHGIVSSASIMTCCPAFDDFACFAVAHPEFDYGVHLTLTCDLPEQPWGPVTWADNVPSLVDEDGLFPMWPRRDVDVEEAARELRAQIRRALDAGIRISHIDHHMWVMFHSRPLLSLYTQLGIEFDLPIRIGRNAPIQIQRHDAEMAHAYAQHLAILASRGFPILDFIEGANYSVQPADKREYFLRHIRQFPPGLSEIVAHCSIVDESLNPPDVEGRRADLEILASLEIEEEFRRNRLQRVDWRDV